MEQTMYEDGDRNNSTPLKPSFILDFNQEPRSRPPMDLGLLKLASPELEKYLIHQEGSVVTAVTPTTQILFPKCVTQEQENYARGFIDALDELHRRQGIPSHVIKKEKNDDDDSNFYHNKNNNNINNKNNNNNSSGDNMIGKYHHDSHLSNNHLNNNNHNTYSESLNELSHSNGLFFINNNYNNLSHNNNNTDNIISSFNNKTHNLSTLHNINNITNNNFIIINNNINSNKLSSSSSPLQSIPSLIAFNNNKNNNNNNVEASKLSQTTLTTNLSTLGVISLNYNLANNNINNINNNINSSTNNNNLNNNNVLLTNPDISLNENIFSKEISPSLSPYPILPPAQTLLTRSPNTKNFQPSTPQPLDSKPFISTTTNNNQQQDPNKSIYNKTPQKRSLDMTKFNPNLIQNFSNLSPSSFKTTTDELTNQTVPYLISSPPSISSTGGSPISNSPSEEVDRLEIKRARNRLAAQKCRSRKLERIAVLSQRVDELKQQNVGLELLRAGVVNSIDQLQQQLQQHSQCAKSLPRVDGWSVGDIKEDL